MKKGSLFILSLFLVFIVSCGSSGSSSPTDPTPTDTNLTLAGNFGETNNNILKNVLPVRASTISDISKIIVFNSSGEHTTATVSNNKFSIGVSKGEPLGVIFVDAQDKFIGYLTLGDGLDSFPLSKVKDGTTTIDLKTLALSGDVFTPYYNPVGTELVLANNEKSLMAGYDDMFSSIIKNPDMDGNGKIDFLENKFFNAKILYFINGGSFSGTKVDANSNPTISSYKILLSAYSTTSSLPETVTFTGPDGSGLSGQNGDSKVDGNEKTYFSENVSDPSIPKAGTYKINFDTSTINFTISDQSSSEGNIILALPSIELNSDNETINKVVWEYKTKNGESFTNPSAIISKIEVQIDDASHNRIYDSGNLSANVFEHILTKTIKWSDVGYIHMAYNDVFGNSNVVTFNKQN